MPPSKTSSTNESQPREVALAFLGHCFRGQIEQVLVLLAPEATWWVLGDRAHLKVSGTRDRPAIERFLRGVARLFPEGMEYTVEGVTAEGGRVAVEATSTARMADGRAYGNRYHFLMQVHDGQVVAMREYLDTLYAWQVQEGTASPSA